ncbi:MAG: hypothetical protein CMH63_02615 [Nanoarchaeota archaeon]|jgi:hypothetical protein|nr:hypothetical protein [Nanoarchaeota archaeon]|tara:strand:+ start:18432 stop:19349 length:918 start_codon:yes stop_codon:yes gene_type:complete
MSIHFLSPNPEQKQTLNDLEKLLDLLKVKPNRKLKQNARFVKNFTKALLIITKKHKTSPKKHLEAKPMLGVTHQIHPFKSKGLHDSFRERISQKLPSPPPPPIPSVPQMPKASIIKAGVKGTQSLPIKPKLTKERGTLKFNILEPQMESLDWKIFKDVKTKLKARIMETPDILENENFLMEEIKKSCTNLKIKYSDSYLQKIKYYLIKYTKGYGKVDPLMQEPKVTEIICNSYSDLKVVYDGETLSTNIAFNTNEELDNFILNLAEKFNKTVSESQPDLEISTPKLKVSAFYNPIMGSKFTIKKQ